MSLSNVGTKALFLCCSLLLTNRGELNLFPVAKDGKLGFIDVLGNEVIPLQFGAAGDATRFQEGVANVGVASLGWGYIDATGKFIVQPVFWWADRFSEGLGCVQLPGESMGWGFVDRTGKLLGRGLKAQSSFHEGLVAEQINDKFRNSG
jgi:hypothetical protein